MYYFTPPVSLCIDFFNAAWLYNDANASHIHLTTCNTAMV